MEQEGDALDVDGRDPPTTAVLDNPVWHALTGRQGKLGSRGALAGRFDPAVSPFGGFAGDPTPEGWRELAGFTGPTGRVAVVGHPGPLPPGWRATWTIPIIQMVGGGSGERPTRGPAVANSSDGPDPVVTLGVSDVTEMLELARLARPGPFLERTVEFGGYMGIRRDGRLVAMAGERLRPRGFAEISAVSTHPDHRRAGLGERMVEAVTGAILERGERPFLHVAHDNDSAIRLYSSLGFSSRREFVFTVVEGPDRGG